MNLWALASEAGDGAAIAAALLPKRLIGESSKAPALKVPMPNVRRSIFMVLSFELRMKLGAGYGIAARADADRWTAPREVEIFGRVGAVHGELLATSIIRLINSGNSDGMQFTAADYAAINSSG
ncbi:hypothetical protein [Mesorhizobium sp. M1348]|uniref:hypothetical protein n=1 Tax=unclassified Mesorhizobium TaxID=325217 RepID=UPI003335906E